MIRIKTGVPGPKSLKIAEHLRKVNGAWAVPFPFVHSAGGEGSYSEDIDGNRFLDFGSQIATNPFGYNHDEMINVVKKYSTRHPIKYAGQDFIVPEHGQLLDELISISPKGMNGGFLVNSGAEAVENAIKLCMHHRPGMKFSTSFDGAFHGRTLGALSLHHSKAVHRHGYLLESNRELPFDESASEVLQSLVTQYGAEAVGFVILEHLQGEGGYRIPSSAMVKKLFALSRKYNIPYVADEVQAGMGRTGKWWSFEHYGIVPDVFSVAKALQVGAVIAPRADFPQESGSISSTWGGGHVLDMALGMKTIEMIKRDKLLARNTKMGAKIVSGLRKIDSIDNVRGRGLMIGFDLPDSRIRDTFVIEALKKGLIVLGAGDHSIRVIPPYIIDQKEIDEGLRVIENVAKSVTSRGFESAGKICDFMDCGKSHT
ncbi:MAG: aminotransferase class III-fold pyridoxal phosphate-dependent enzyme [Candidatus Pacearchaeota archaeon]